MRIISGKLPGAKKTVIYGPEGIGKSTFASCFPQPLFIDTEGSTRGMDVSRTETPGSWSMLLEQIRYIKTHPEVCRTLILDTADWAEMLCIDQVCTTNHKNSIEEFGYGKGYVYVQEEFGRLLNLLSEVIDAGIHVTVTAHAKMRKFEQPDELGAYDRWEMKLTKGVSPMLKEWADMVLFANYKTFVVNVDGQGAQKGKNKAQGGKRVLYTSHHPCWDAKNRYGLPEEIPFTYASIASIIEPAAQDSGKETPPLPQTLGIENAARSGKEEKEPAETAAITKDKNAGAADERTGTANAKASGQSEQICQPSPVGQAGKKEPDGNGQAGGDDSAKTAQPGPDPRIPRKLRELMMARGVDEWDIQNVVAARGYFPADMPVWDYPADFVEGCLVGAWDSVYGMVREMKEKDALIFN